MAKRALGSCLLNRCTHQQYTVHLKWHFRWVPPRWIHQNIHILSPFTVTYICMQSKSKHVTQLFMHTLHIQYKICKWLAHKYGCFMTIRHLTLHAQYTPEYWLSIQQRNRAIDFIKGLMMAPTVSFILNKGSGNWVQLRGMFWSYSQFLVPFYLLLDTFPAGMDTGSDSSNQSWKYETLPFF